MKKLIFILLLYPTFLFAQTPTSPVSFNTLSDLRAQVGTENVQVLLNGLTTTNDGNGGVYMWDSNSSLTDDGFITVKPTSVSGNGRWRRIGNGNTIKGSVSFSGLTLQTAYTVPYQGGSLPFTPITVIVIPRTSAAAALSYISSITNTGFKNN